jgi:hypothetical protein
VLSSVSRSCSVVWQRLRQLGPNCRGQGTVEYVGLLLVVGLIIGGVIGASHKLGGGDIPKTIMTKLKSAVEGVKDNGPSQ